MHFCGLMNIELLLQSCFTTTDYVCRYHNLMGGETIGVLELLTSSITAVITHPTLADRWAIRFSPREKYYTPSLRLAAMLNYFLKTLTGPESKSFKVLLYSHYSQISSFYLSALYQPLLQVSNLEKYSFRPAETVAKICQIYLNLGESQGFVMAVPRDGRSYSKELFTGTERVLIKVECMTEMVCTLHTFETIRAQL